MAGWDVRRLGVIGPDGSPRLRVYASDQSQYCHEQSMEVLGLGRDAIRLVPSDDSYRMRIDALTSMIAEDRARGPSRPPWPAIRSVPSGSRRP